jgi:glycosyltransferase involved in cell wall biosynthesis
MTQVTHSFRPHGKMAPLGIVRFVVLFIVECVLNLPGLISLRMAYRSSARKRPIEPVVVWVGDNLDEVNGIALSSRIMLRKLRAQGRTIFLFGVAFHSKQPRTEEADQSVVLAPGRYSMEQAGYAASEVTLLRFSHFLRFLREHPVDIIELQTPGPVSILCLLAAKFIGIRTLSHYRTDILTYSKLLVDNRLAVWSINTVTKIVTHWAGSVVTPSEAYSHKVQEMGVKPERIFKLPRGVDLENFHPEKAQLGAWLALGLPTKGIKLLYVGRISKEKNLELIVDAFANLIKSQPNLSLTMVGEGPYRIELESRLAKFPGVKFTGVVQGENLASLFASADLLVFPSLTDTFGNSVVEALASGIPCITSNQGGPCEIIVDGESGMIFDHTLKGDLEAKILSLVAYPERLKAFKSQARERALLFTYDRAADAFWNFYRNHYLTPL